MRKEPISIFAMPSGTKAVKFDGPILRVVRSALPPIRALNVRVDASKAEGCG